MTPLETITKRLEEIGARASMVSINTSFETILTEYNTIHALVAALKVAVAAIDQIEQIHCDLKVCRCMVCVATPKIAAALGGEVGR